MTQVKVINESYRATIDNSDHETAHAAIAHTYNIMVNQTGKPGWTRWASIQRITHHEPIDNGFFGTQAENVTGEIMIESPGQLAERSELSRYHPNNGWVIPETIEIDKDGETVRAAAINA